MEDSYASWQTHVIIRRNVAGPAQSTFSTGCPVRNPTVDASDRVTSLNGIIFVGLRYGVGNNHYSFTTLLAAYPALVGIVINIDTGELREYIGDAAGDPDVCFSGEQIGFAKFRDSRWVTDREVEQNAELGEMYVADLKAQIYKHEIRGRKIYCDKKKLAALDKDSLVFNQEGMTGTGLVERDTLEKLVQSDLQDYYIVILYTKNKSADSDNVARCEISPCTKFNRFEKTAENERTTEITLDAKAVYAYSLPLDHSNIADYTPSS